MHLGLIAVTGTLADLVVVTVGGIGGRTLSIRFHSFRFG